MSRSSWKGPYLDKRFFKTKKLHKVWSRQSVIPSSLRGKKIFVYNGKAFKRIFITKNKIGFKFGEFCKTRLFNKKKVKKKIHGSKK